MKKITLPLLAFILFSSHDMFLKLDTFYLQPNSEATIQLFNGTFEESDNTIDRDRMIDVSMVMNGKRTAVDTTQWSDEGKTTVLNFATGEAGTYVVGVSTRARSLAMEAQAFNDYLAHDGVLDMIELREQNNTTGENAVEKYSKHVKTIFQVGETRSDDWQTDLGYPIEFIPLSNPYDLHAGDELEVKLLRDGKPLANQLVYVGSDGGAHGHSHDEDHGHSHDGDDADHTHTGGEHRTDANGILKVAVANDGIWHLRTIHLVESTEAELTHESNWATLTFQVDHGQPHSHAAEEHGHSHDHEDGHTHEHGGGIPAYAYWIGSLLLVGGLFFWFNRKS